MRADMIVSPRLQRMLSSDPQRMESDVLDDLAFATDRTIKSRGYCPVDTSRLRGGHQVRNLGLLDKAIVNAVYYWFYVVYGHRTAKLTEANRRAFFAKYGKGGYIRRATAFGYGGWVPPNNYLLRAIFAVFLSGEAQRIVDRRVKQFVGGGY